MWPSVASGHHANRPCESRLSTTNSLGRHYGTGPIMTVMGTPRLWDMRGGKGAVFAEKQYSRAERCSHNWGGRCDRIVRRHARDRRGRVPGDRAAIGAVRQAFGLNLTGAGGMRKSGKLLGGTCLPDSNGQTVLSSGGASYRESVATQRTGSGFSGHPGGLPRLPSRP